MPEQDPQEEYIEEESQPRMTENEYLQRMNSQNYVQAILTDVQSGKTLPWLNTDIPYSNLPKEIVHEQLALLQTFQLITHYIYKIHNAEHPGVNVDWKDPSKLSDLYSSPQFLISRVYGNSNVYPSLNGWARELTVTSRFRSNSDNRKRKWFGLKKAGDEEE